MPEPYRAVVIGASGGIGGALQRRLAASGVAVHALSRGGTGHGRLDVADEASIAAAMADLPDGPPIRLAIVASGLLHDEDQQPEKSLKALNAARLARSFAVNAIGPVLVAKHLVPLMPREGRCVFAALSARVGSITDNRLGGWYGYRASKAALNQFVRTLSVEAARSHPGLVAVALHPGTVATALSEPFRGAVPDASLFSPDGAADHLLRVIDGLTVADTGGFFAWTGDPIPF